MVCLVAAPALASHQNHGQSKQLQAGAEKRAVNSKGPLVTASLESGAGMSVARSKSEARSKTSSAGRKKGGVRRKATKRRIRERLVAKINLSTQTMNVHVDGKLKHSWKISSGARGYHTPTGSYKPYYMTRMHYSRKYNNAPMPHSVFFRGGFAIHATGAVRRLGTPASHGCVRLSPAHARQFFSLVKKYKKAGTRIRISGVTPASRRLRTYARVKPRRSYRRTNWDAFQGYSANYVSYRRRRAAPVRRIRIGRARRNPNGTLFNW